MRPQIEAALKELSDEFGITIKVGNGSFADQTASFKLEMSINGEDGEAVPTEARDFTAYASRLGMKPEWLGQKINHHGTEYTIVGLKPKATKNNVVVESARGARYVIPSTSVIASMGRS